MTEQGDEKEADRKRFSTEKLSKEEIDRLVQGVDDIYFGGLGKQDDEKKPSPEESSDEPVKDKDDGE